jgi:DNA-binding GntR family transcriptional regulator
VSVSDHVHLTLRRRLMSGHYVPGSQLKEEAVAADLGVSRTPVRAAIQRLITEGLLEPASKRGALVTQWRTQDAEDVFNLRIMLEGYSANLAAKLIDDEQLAELEALNAGILKAVQEKPEGYLDAIHRQNLAFHLGILAACGSVHLRNFGGSLLDFPLVAGGFYIYTDDDMMESVRQHGEVIAALRVRNADWARAAMTCHLAAAIERFKRAERQGKSAAPADV